MINIGDTLKRAWQILWKYKLLWVFAFLLAVSGGGSGGGGSRYTFNNNDLQNNLPFFTDGNTPQWWYELQQWTEQNIVPLFATEEKALVTVLWMVAGIFLIAIVFGLLFALVRYPSETAIIRLVDEHEGKGIKYRFKEAWKLGWDRRAFRLWLVDLVIGAPAAGIVLLLIGLFSFFAFSIARQAEAHVFPGGVIGILIVVLFLLAFSFLMIVVNLVRNYISRFVTIEGNGVWDSFRQGWTMFKSHLKDTILMALVMFGVGIAFGFVMLLAMFLLIPAYAILVIPGAIVAAIPAGLAYGVTSLFSGQVLSWIVAGLVALPFFFTVVFAPVTLLGGMFAVYRLNIWTLVYRQFKAANIPPVLANETSAPPPLMSSED